MRGNTSGDAGEAASRSEGIIKSEDVVYPPEPPPRETEPGSELEHPETHLGDDMARRAFWAALFAFLFLPFALYSLWLALKLSVYSGEVSDRGLRNFYLALALNPLVLIFWVFLISWVWSIVA